MPKVLQIPVPTRPIPAHTDPTCLLWEFIPGQLQFLSQVLGVAGIRFTTHLPPSAASLSTIICPPSADLNWLPFPLPVVHADFSPNPAPLSVGGVSLPGVARQSPGIFQLPSQVIAFLSQVDQYCYPERGRILNVFGLQPKSGTSTIAFGLANGAKNSVFVDASCSLPDSFSRRHSPEMRKLGFPAICNFSSRDLEADLLVSRLREILPVVQNTRFLQLYRTNPDHISHIFSLLVRAFALVVIDWGLLDSVERLNDLSGQTLVVRNYPQAAVNRQLLLQLHRQRIPIINNRVPARIVSATRVNQSFSVPHCRELKRLQDQGLGTLWPKSLQINLAQLLRNILAAAA